MIYTAESVMGMFTGATSFNQNLCAWKEKFPYGFESSTEIFDNTACTYDARPRLRNEFGGPFCASDCSPTANKKNEAEVPLDEPSSVAVDEPSGASFASSYAAVMSATVLYLCFSIYF